MTAEGKAIKIARRFGLTDEEVKSIQQAALRTYQYIAADLGESPRKGKNKGLWKRSEIIEIVTDANRLETIGFDKHSLMTSRVKAFLHNDYYCDVCRKLEKEGLKAEISLAIGAAEDGGGRCVTHKEDMIMLTRSHLDLVDLLRPVFEAEWYE